jgi:two-component system cell cycle sensor histidine kinase/response regulator CckA
VKISFTKTFKFQFLLLGIVGWVLPLITIILGIGFFSRNLKADFDHSLANIKAREGMRLREQQHDLVYSQMRQKALDVAQELSLYLTLQKSRAWPEVLADQQFRQIAVQPVGVMGETFLLDPENRQVLLTCCLSGGSPVQCAHFRDALDELVAKRLWTSKLSEIRLFKAAASDYYCFLVPVSLRPRGGPALVVGVLADLKALDRSTNAAPSILRTAVNLSQALIDTRITGFQKEVFIFFGGMGLLGLLASLSLARRQTREVAALTAAAEAYNSGDLDYRTSDPSRNELGQLAHTLNLMAASLQENTVSRAEWENTFNVIPDQIMLLDAEQRVIKVNRAAADYMGIAPEAAGGRKCYELMHPSQTPTMSCGFAQTLRDGTRSQMEFCSLDNRATFLITLDPLRDREGKVIGAVHVARDITIFKKVQEELAQTSHFLEQIIKSAPLAVAVVNAQGLFTHVNPQFFAEYGYTPQDILQKPYYLIYASKKERLQLMRELKERGEIFSRRALVQHRDGRILPSRISIRILYGANGELLGSVAMGRNIADEADLQRQMEQVQKLEAVATLSGGLAHNFNNLLTVIMGLANLMMSKIGPDHPFYADLREIELQVRAGRELTENLLTFTQDTRFETQSLVLNDLIKGTVAIFARTRRDIQVALDLAPELPPVEADPGQMQQVLMNLLINAWQAMPQGGTITIESRAVTVMDGKDAVWHLEPGLYASFAVIDTGVGMEDETLERIFEPLYTTKPPGQGTGLGLASVYHIIKHHQGAIQVQSRKGQGSTFCIFLPVSQSLPEVLAPKDRRIVYGRGTILVVDDEPALRRVAARLLEKLGYRVIKAAGGEKAVELFQKESPEIDLVLMDMIMPGMNGLQTMEQIRSLNSKVPIILCSGYGDGKGKSLPPDVGYLSKPYTLDVLSQKVAGALHH